MLHRFCFVVPSATARLFGFAAANRITPNRLALSIALVVTLTASMLLAFAVSPAAAAAGCGAAANPVVCENELPGTDAEVWDIEGAGDSSIQGFSTDIRAPTSALMCRACAK